MSAVPWPDLGTGVVEVEIPAADGVLLRGGLWLPADGTEVRGGIVLVHGMNEHIGRWAATARALAAAGWAVLAHDQRGHGRTAGSVDRLMHLADRGGWEAVTGDVLTVSRELRRRVPGVPVVWMGHSFGSFVVRGAAARFGPAADGVILQGTAGPPSALQAAGAVLAGGAAALRPRGPARLLRLLADSSTTSRGPEEWLTGIVAEQEAFRADPWCGNLPSRAFYRDLTAGLVEVGSRRSTDAVPDDLPVLLASGEDDDLARGGAGPLAVARALREGGVRDVTVRTYPGARHELAHDVSREAMWRDTVTWLEEHVRARA